ncbi:MAG: hypothetical protein ACK4GO_09140 [Gemmobacter sp.]
MRPRTLWLPVMALTAFAGALGATQGLRAAARGETPVIEAMAARYLATSGPDARATDCQARPGTGMLGWLVVSCGPPGQPARHYHVNRLGWLVQETAAPPPAPET